MLDTSKLFKCLCRTEKVNKKQYKEWLENHEAELLEFTYKT